MTRNGLVWKAIEHPYIQRLVYRDPTTFEPSRRDMRVRWDARCNVGWTFGKPIHFFCAAASTAGGLVTDLSQLLAIPVLDEAVASASFVWSSSLQMSTMGADGPVAFAPDPHPASAIAIKKPTMYLVIKPTYLLCERRAHVNMNECAANAYPLEQRERQLQ